jgi:hypothetical protein
MHSVVIPYNLLFVGRCIHERNTLERTQQDFSSHASHLIALTDQMGPIRLPTSFAGAIYLLRQYCRIPRLITVVLFPLPWMVSR